jgi:transcriptional regulator with XRE-family HTH domain
MVPAMQTGRPSKRSRPPFGERLHAFREEAGLTQAQVAEKLGITQRAYAFWEREVVALKPEQLSRLGDVLGVSLDALISEKPMKKHVNGGPSGKARQVFEKVSKLPRHQQKKVIEVVEALVDSHARK